MSLLITRKKFGAIRKKNIDTLNFYLHRYPSSDSFSQCCILQKKLVRQVREHATTTHALFFCCDVETYQLVPSAKRTDLEQK